MSSSAVAGLPGSGDTVPVLDSVLGNLELAGQMVPALCNLQLLRTWAGINPLTDLLSVLGRVDAVPGLYIALPGDAGYTLGPCCARLLADEMLGRPALHPLEDFSPARLLESGDGDPAAACAAPAIT